MRAILCALKKFDDFLASDKPLQTSAEKLFQAPIADGAYPHWPNPQCCGRMAGVPIKSEF